MGDPASERKWDWSIGRHPFAVEFPSHMDMCAGGKTTLAGWMTEVIARLYDCVFGNPVFGGDVQIYKYPAGLFKPSPSISRTTMPRSERTTLPEAEAVTQASES